MPTLVFSAALDTDVPIVEEHPDGLKATSYFEDYLFKLFQDIEAINILAGLAYGVIEVDGQPTLSADIATDTLEFIEGTSINITTAVGAPDALTITNDDPFPEAPIDGSPYARRDAGWLNINTLGFVDDGDNVGAGAEVFVQKAGTLLEFRTLVSADGSVAITEGATEIDLAAAQLSGTVDNSILTFDAVANEYTELSEVTISWVAGVLTMSVLDDGAVLRTVMTADADGSGILYFDEVRTFETAVNGNKLYDGIGDNPNLTWLKQDETELAKIFHFGDDYTIRNQVDSGLVILAARNSSSSNIICLTASGDGALILNFAGTKEFETKSGGVIVDDEIEINGAFNHDGSTYGVYGTAPIAKQTGVAVTIIALHAAIVALGFISA